MKRTELEELAQTLEKAGYEILKIEPAKLVFDLLPHTPVSGAYNLQIAPIKECERERKML